jgi:Mg2+/Co2+ transporter CorB
MIADGWFWVTALLLALIVLALVGGNRLLEPLGYRVIHRRKSSGQSPRKVGPVSVDGADALPSAANGTDGLERLVGLEVSDVMTHRLAMQTIDAGIGPEAIVKTMLASPHTRMPIWEHDADNIVGVLHAKDLLRALSEVGNDYSKLDVLKIAMKPRFVPDTTPAQDQLAAFLRDKAHLAVVVDEYGEVEGLVTLEDIVEEVVGRIADEHDIDVQGVKQEPDGSIVVDGSVPIRDLNRALGWALPDENATTIAGLVIHEAQSIPMERQAFTFHGKRFVVMKREKNRITRLRIKPLQVAV